MEPPRECVLSLPFVALLIGVQRLVDIHIRVSYAEPSYLDEYPFQFWSGHSSRLVRGL